MSLFKQASSIILLLIVLLLIPIGGKNGKSEAVVNELQGVLSAKMYHANLDTDAAMQGEY